MGTPAFAVPSLEALAGWKRGLVAGVYTQPDRPAGRGHKPAMSAVKLRAQELGLPVFQPQSLKPEEAQEQLAALEPDVLAVAAYGLILPQAVLDMPRLDCVNVHASLLPAWRGAAPIQRAVMESWRPGAQAGVSIMRVIYRLDAGPVYAAEGLPVGEHTAGSMEAVLACRGAELLVGVLDALLDGRAKPADQDERLVTYAAKLDKEDGYIDWTATAAQVHARIRGVTPRPGARTVLEWAAAGACPSAMPLLLSPGSIGDDTGGEIPGTLRRTAEGLAIACADAWYHLGKVRPQGRADMPVKALLNGLLRGLPQGRAGRARRP